MGTNFYFLTKKKEAACRLSGGRYEITDSPYFCYEIGCAKTSGGWLPIFRGYNGGAKSVEDYKKAYETGDFEICDEYGTPYDWERFTRRVLEHNGGTHENAGKNTISCNSGYPFNDPIIKALPISHLDYFKEKGYDVQIYLDPEGYEFDMGYFD